MRRGPNIERRRFWLNLIRRQQGSCQSVADFCREQGVTTVSFYRWRSRLAKEVSQKALVPVQAPAAVSFVPLPLTQVMASRLSKFAIRLPNGWQVTVPSDFDELALRRLLAATADFSPTAERRDA